MNATAMKLDAEKPRDCVFCDNQTLASCEICDDYCCESCSQTCTECGKTFCPDCEGDDGVCHLCAKQRDKKYQAFETVTENLSDIEIDNDLTGDLIDFDFSACEEPDAEDNYEKEVSLEVTVTLELKMKWNWDSDDPVRDMMDRIKADIEKKLKAVRQ